MLPPLRTIKNIMVTLIIIFFLYGCVITLIQAATGKHWLLGAAITILYGSGLVLGIQDLRSKEARKFPIYKGIGIFFLIILVGATVAASTSLLLELQGWATYIPVAKHNLIEFNGYYLWIFLSMLPGLEITTSLDLAEPLHPQGVVAGLPVVAFRAFVIFGLLGSLKIWWQARQEERAQEPAKKAPVK